MNHKTISLNFGTFILKAKLFDNPIAKQFAQNLPYTITLTQWGEEVYGGIGDDFGEHDPIPAIPPGGIAYTNNGNYLCIFFGQTPAWAVEYIGHIEEESWEVLKEQKDLSQVTIEAL